MAGIFSVWNSQSVADLFTWLRQFNETHRDDPVRFFGFDIQYETADDVREFKTSLGLKSPAGLSVCAAVALKAFTHDSQLSDIDHEHCLEAVDQLDQVLKSMPETRDLLWAKIQAVDIRSFENQLYFYTRDLARSDSARDAGMAQQLAAIRALTCPGAKTILWAHNVHLSEDSPEFEGGLFVDTTSMGTLLSKQLGANYKAFALTGYHVSANWPGHPPQDLPPPSPDSVEVLLHDHQLTSAFVDLKQSFLPSGKVMQFGLNELIPSQQFDGFFFLDRVEAMQNPKTL